MNIDVTEILIYTICCAGFLYQTIMEVRTQYFSGATTARVSRTSLAELTEFPAVFYFIVRPGMRETELSLAGYHSSEDYFFGRSRFNQSVLGWGGHEENGEELGEVKGELVKC